MRGIPEMTFRFQAVLRVSGIEEIPLKAHNQGIPARANDRMIGPPRSNKVALDCVEFEAKGQASTEGFVGPVLATVGRTIGQRPGAWRPRAPRCPSPPRASQPVPAPRGAKAFPLRPSSLEARNGALLQALAFELAQGRENCELEPAAG